MSGMHSKFGETNPSDDDDLAGLRRKVEELELKVRLRRAKADLKKLIDEEQ